MIFESIVRGVYSEYLCADFFFTYVASRGAGDMPTGNFCILGASGASSGT